MYIYSCNAKFSVNTDVLSTYVIGAYTIRVSAYTHTHLPADTSEHAAGQQRSPGLAGIPVTAPKPGAAVRPRGHRCHAAVASLRIKPTSQRLAFLPSPKSNTLHLVFKDNSPHLSNCPLCFSVPENSLLQIHTSFPKPRRHPYLLSLLAGAEHALHLLAFRGPPAYAAVPLTVFEWTHFLCF